VSIEVEGTAPCALPVAACWEKLCDLERAKHYVPGVRDVSFVTSARSGLGATRIAHGSAGDMYETVVEWNEGKGFTLALHRGERPPWPFREARFRYAIEPQGAATRIRLTMTVRFPFGIAGRALGALARPALAKNLATLARRVARHWETDAPVS